jgi:hypothetical protein
MDSAHFFRLFRDHAALQAVQEELAAGRRNALIMAIDDRVYLGDALELISITASYCLGDTRFSPSASGLTPTD